MCLFAAPIIRIIVYQGLYWPPLTWEITTCGRLSCCVAQFHVEWAPQEQFVGASLRGAGALRSFAQNWWGLG